MKLLKLKHVNKLLHTIMFRFKHYRNLKIERSFQLTSNMLTYHIFNTVRITFCL